MKHAERGPEPKGPLSFTCWPNIFLCPPGGQRLLGLCVAQNHLLDSLFLQDSRDTQGNQRCWNQTILEVALWRILTGPCSIVFSLGSLPPTHQRLGPWVTFKHVFFFEGGG